MKKILYISLLFLFGMVYSQSNKKLIKANNLYDKLAYAKAIKSYEILAKNGSKSLELYQNLGNSYYFTGDLLQANVWYNELFNLNEPVDAEYYYRYSQTLKANQQYDKANKYLDLFNQKIYKDTRGNIYKNGKDYKSIIDKASGRYVISETGINSKLSDYGSAIYGNQLIFSSSRGTTGFTNSRTSWTNHSFTNLYSATIRDDGILGSPKKFSNTINSKFHEDTPIFTRDLKTVYFTRNNYNKGKIGKDENQSILLKLYKATLQNGKWENVTELPFNSDNYSIAHPALSPDEKTLYFASNMPGTKGQSDIFKVEIINKNTYGSPVNLTGSLNTEGRETFPYITKNNELYFASDGHQGLGGLDIYATQLDNKGNPGLIVNVGAPVNSPMDDFAFIMDSDTKMGYFSSNRDEGLGYDDIYSFVEKVPISLICKQQLVGKVVNEKTLEILSNAQVTIYDSNHNQLQIVTTDSDGNYSFEVECGKDYNLKAVKEEFGSKEIMVSISNDLGKTDSLIPLVRIEKTIVSQGVPIIAKESLKEGVDLAKLLNIKIIRFDLAKWAIRKDATIELAKILAVMNENPTMKIDVRSHTDCRASYQYNMTLSDKRVKSTIAWLVKKGIAVNRLTGKGYGESQLLNGCKDGVSCTEEEHQLNRRSEFIILSIN